MTNERNIKGFEVFVLKKYNKTKVKSSVVNFYISAFEFQRRQY